VLSTNKHLLIVLSLKKILLYIKESFKVKRRLQLCEQFNEISSNTDSHLGQKRIIVPRIVRIRGIAIKGGRKEHLASRITLEQGHEEASRPASQRERRDPDPHY